MRTTDVFPYDCCTWLNGQISWTEVVRACRNHNAVYVARVIKHARTVVFCSRRIVVRGVFVGAARNCCSAVACEVVTTEVDPNVNVENNPLRVVCVRTSSRCPIVPYACGYIALAHQGVVLRSVGCASNFPAASGITFPITDDVQNDEICFGTLNQREPIVSIGEVVHGLISLREDVGRCRSVRNDVNITRRDHRSCSERVPVLVGTGHRWRVAYVRVSVAAEVDGLIGGVINFEVFVIAATLGIFREKQPALRGSSQACSEEHSRQQQVE